MVIPAGCYTGDCVCGVCPFIWYPWFSMYFRRFCVPTRLASASRAFMLSSSSCSCIWLLGVLLCFSPSTSVSVVEAVLSSAMQFSACLLAVLSLSDCCSLSACFCFAHFFFCTRTVLTFVRFRCCSRILLMRWPLSLYPCAYFSFMFGSDIPAYGQLLAFWWFAACYVQRTDGDGGRFRSVLGYLSGDA